MTAYNKINQPVVTATETVSPLAMPQQTDTTGSAGLSMSVNQERGGEREREGERERHVGRSCD